MNDIPLTKEMLQDLPIIDIHIHLPGTISPLTAWELGIRNKLITIFNNKDGTKEWKDGPVSLSTEDSYDNYSDIFIKKLGGVIELDKYGTPIDLRYNINEHDFKSFDRVMATVQGHRHPPGGIQTDEDLEFILEKYLEECLKHNIFYTEILQNIRISYQVYPHLPDEEARENLYRLFAKMSKVFEEKGVHVRFLQCFNKTKAASLNGNAQERAMESALWLKEAERVTPGVFVGIESAGHEKDRTGWPMYLKNGYDQVKEMGLGCEAHAGEGIGVEHMMDAIRTLPITRLAHGFQVIEDTACIKEVREREVVLVMAPLVNLKLGACIHATKDNNNQITPLCKSKGGEKTYITDLYKHPFFSLLRDHKLKINLCSDNPYMINTHLKEMIAALAGLHNADNREFDKDFQPLLANELLECCIVGINASFCEDSIKQKYKDLCKEWAMKYNIATKNI